VLAAAAAAFIYDDECCVIKAKLNVMTINNSFLSSLELSALCAIFKKLLSFEQH